MIRMGLVSLARPARPAWVNLLTYGSVEGLGLYVGSLRTGTRLGKQHARSTKSRLLSYQTPPVDEPRRIRDSTYPDTSTRATRCSPKCFDNGPQLVRGISLIEKETRGTTRRQSDPGEVLHISRQYVECSARRRLEIVRSSRCLQPPSNFPFSRCAPPPHPKAVFPQLGQSRATAGPLAFDPSPPRTVACLLLPSPFVRPSLAAWVRLSSHSAGIWCFSWFMSFPVLPSSTMRYSYSSMTFAPQASCLPHTSLHPPTVHMAHIHSHDRARSPSCASS